MWQAGFLPDDGFQPFFLKLLAERRGTAALPDDGVGGGLAGGAFPDDRRLALVGDADAFDVGKRHAGLLHDFPHNGDAVMEYLVGVVLHPARLGINLAQLAVSAGGHLAVFINKQSGAARRPFIDSQDVAFDLGIFNSYSL